MAPAMIETFDLIRRYGDLTAVNRLNLKVQQGEIFGLLGPNGAGKTTTILMLLGLTEPTAGKSLVAGLDPTRDPLGVKRITGYMPDSVGFYDEMSGRHNLRYTADLNGLPTQEGEKRISNLLERVGLADVADRRVGTYSRGMRQRLGLADVLLKGPQVVILDEPTLGLDPEGAREFLVMIRSLAREGMTVLLSSHLLHQVQQICDRVGIFVKGKMIACGRVDHLAEQALAKDPLQLTLEVSPYSDGLVKALRNLESVSGVHRQEDGRLRLTSNRDIRSQVSRTVHEQGAAVLHMHQEGRTLDDIYRRYFSGEGELDGQAAAGAATALA